MSSQLSGLGNSMQISAQALKALNVNLGLKTLIERDLGIKITSLSDAPISRGEIGKVVDLLMAFSGKERAHDPHHAFADLRQALQTDNLNHIASQVTYLKTSLPPDVLPISRTLDLGIVRDYQTVLGEMQHADFSGLSLNPQKYVADRIPSPMLSDLAQIPGSTVTLHRGEVFPEPTWQKIDFEGRDCPATFYLDGSDPTSPKYHVLNLSGEVWFNQTLYTLAAAGVDPAKVTSRVEDERFNIGQRVADCLTPTLQAHPDITTIFFCNNLREMNTLKAACAPAAADAVCIGPLDTLRQKLMDSIDQARHFDWDSYFSGNFAVELTQKKMLAKLPADFLETMQNTSLTPMHRLAYANDHLMKSPMRPTMQNLMALTNVGQMEVALEHIIESPARPSEKVQYLLSETFQGIAGLVAPLGKIDLDAPDVSAFLRLDRGREKDEFIRHDVISIGGQKIMMVNLFDAHGDISYHVSGCALQALPHATVAYMGTTGSNTVDIPVGSLVSPTILFNSTPGLEALPLQDRQSQFAPTVPACESVCTLLEEHREGIAAMLSHSAFVTDMESYYAAFAAHNLDLPPASVVNLITDVTVSPESGAQSKKTPFNETQIYRQTVIPTLLELLRIQL